MSVKFYTAQDLGGGVQAINVADPANPQDVATKHYVDTHPPTLFSKQVLWETAYSMVCSANNYAGGWAALSSGPSTQTVTKRQTSTGIRVKLGATCWITPASGQVFYGVQVNGSTIVQMFVYWINTTYHATLPWAEKTLWPSQFSQVGVTGNIPVGFYVATGAGTTWHTDANDFCWWTISEIMP